MGVKHKFNLLNWLAVVEVFDETPPFHAFLLRDLSHFCTFCIISVPITPRDNLLSFPRSPKLSYSMYECSYYSVQLYISLWNSASEAPISSSFTLHDHLLTPPVCFLICLIRGSITQSSGYKTRQRASHSFYTLYFLQFWNLIVYKETRVFDLSSFPISTTFSSVTIQLRHSSTPVSLSSPLPTVFPESYSLTIAFHIWHLSSALWLTFSCFLSTFLEHSHLHPQVQSSSFLFLVHLYLWTVTQVITSNWKAVPLLSV